MSEPRLEFVAGHGGTRLAVHRLGEGRPVVLLHGHSHQRYWHRARPGRPHLIAGGSSTERPGFWELRVEDHRALEAVAHPLR